MPHNPAEMASDGSLNHDRDAPQPEEESSCDNASGPGLQAGRHQLHAAEARLGRRHAAEALHRPHPVKTVLVPTVGGVAPPHRLDERAAGPDHSAGVAQVLRQTEGEVRAVRGEGQVREALVQVGAGLCGPEEASQGAVAAEAGLDGQDRVLSLQEEQAGGA